MPDEQIVLMASLMALQAEAMSGSEQDGSLRDARAAESAHQAVEEQAWAQQEVVSRG